MDTSDAQAAKRFAAEIRDEVTARCAAESSGEGTIGTDAALAQLMLEYLEEEGVTVEAHLCPFAETSGRRRCAITAYSLPESSDQLDLFLSAFISDGEELATLTSTELGQLAGKAARFFDYAAKADWSRFSTSPETLEAARRIHAELKTIASVRIFVLTNGLVRDRDIESLEVAGYHLNFEVVDIERLYRLSQSKTARQDIEVDFTAICGRPLACLEMTPRAPEYDTYLAILPGNLVADLYERFGQRLFEFNVRSFLQAKGKVNKGIRDTLRDDPDRFMAYNNGLVATADQIDVGLFHGETTISKIVGLQIVNGAQTTASIHRARKADKIDLSRVAVAIKITKVAPEKLQSFVPLISRFANTQNVIQVADLSANNEFHIELERLSQQIWCPGEESRWFYERARGAYQDAMQREGSTPAKRRDFKRVTPPSQKITKTDLARYLMAWIGRPHVVSMGAQKNFSIFMSELPDLFAPSWKPDRAFYERCIGQAILYRACERVVRAQKFAAYRANIVVYSYAVLSHVSRGELDFNQIWNAQGVSEPLASMLADVTRQVDEAIRASAGARNVTEWCKKAGCWEAVSAISWKVPSARPPEFSREGATATRGERETEPASDHVASGIWEDQEAIEECMRFDATTWAKISYWGVSTSALDYYERGVAHTLSEYAASEWVRKPSVKQARIGARVLRRAREEHLL